MNDGSSMEEDLAFEQQLLAAGLADTAPPEQTQAALLRFTASIAALELATGGANGLRAARGPSARQRLALTAKWLVLGAIGGGVATFVWLQPHERGPSRSAPAPSTSVHSSPPAEQATEQPSAPSAGRAWPTAATGRSTPALSSKAGRTPPPAAKPASDLGAEVAALDGIRTALEIGALASAEQKLASYRRTFPRGALGSEAEVMAIDLLVARGRGRDAASAAERFIAQHPRDPQAGRMRAFLE